MGRHVENNVADLPAAVTDTHSLVWHAGGRRLGSRAAKFFERCEQRQAIVYVPAAVIFECSVLTRSAKIDLRRGLAEFFGDLFANASYRPVDLTPAQVFIADDLRFTRDIFDVLICAAARSLELPLITNDSVIRQSGAVRVLW